MLNKMIETGGKRSIL